MTLPDERYRALRQAPDLFYSLLREPGPLLKSRLRRAVLQAFRHYPLPSELNALAAACPRILRRVDE